MSQSDSLRELLLFDVSNEVKYSEKQLKILEAAIETFSEKGYAATSTNEIAKKAGVAEGTIFRHYHTKKELLIAIVSPLMTKLVGPHMAKDFAKNIFEVEYKSFKDFIRKLALNRYEFVKKHSLVVRILLQEISLHDELKEPYMKLFQDHIYEKFKNKIVEFQDKGEVVPLPPDTIIRLIITTIVGTLVSMFVLLPEKKWDYELEMNSTIQLLVNGLIVK
ncbi:TetR family transcriptional regulator [Anaerobacillus alkalilacustris]|uniref:TetR family transcriptional regulator n=1 Tax=Anaerobacillus alkalilacustris TaxID=393763 RepID=A0A1S2LNM0_9BACI|nr:TetR/AcrR family transcriptional regulator [Anaerobacillus alkalilacustris]OIJ13946.1 TetR family transcriptional regulator [Anaerobacillus alkalilacustris]